MGENTGGNGCRSLAQNGHGLGVGEGSVVLYQNFKGEVWQGQYPTVEVPGMLERWGRGGRKEGWSEREEIEIDFLLSCLRSRNLRIMQTIIAQWKREPHHMCDFKFSHSHIKRAQRNH